MADLCVEALVLESAANLVVEVVTSGEAAMRSPAELFEAVRKEW